jgi:hypothetical protein
LNDVAFISVMHDPKGSLANSLKEALPVLKRHYSNGYIALSENTDRELKRLLEGAGFVVFFIEKRGAAAARRSILQLVQHTGHAHFHYCDLDRMVTWCLSYPEEFEKVKERIRTFDYLIIGRTEAAFRSHPAAWRETEKITNKIFTLEFGSRDEIDVTAGSCGLNKAGLLKIAGQSKAAVTDAEWPMIIKRMEKGKVGFMKVNGLMYREDINHSEQNKTEAERWLSRLRLSYLISETAVHTK